LKDMYPHDGKSEKQHCAKEVHKLYKVAIP
jgi:hypothetical protein